MWTILFDIDGTLIRCGGAGMIAMGQTVAELFGHRDIPEIPLHGRTDRGIVSDLFERLNIDLDGDYSGFYEFYFQRLKSVLKTSNGEVLPGVFELLDMLNELPTVALGILTGNASGAAAIKLEHFGLSEYFLFGGYGDDHADRNDVASQAIASASNCLGSRFDPSKVWVIGDTTNDIRCARSIGAKVLAVSTGGERSEQLSESSPDFLKNDLIEVQQWLSGLR